MKEWRQIFKKWYSWLLHVIATFKLDPKVGRTPNWWPLAPSIYDAIFKDMTEVV